MRLAEVVCQPEEEPVDWLAIRVFRLTRLLNSGSWRTPAAACPKVSLLEDQ